MCSGPGSALAQARAKEEAERLELEEKRKGFMSAAWRGKHVALRDSCSRFSGEIAMFIYVSFSATVEMVGLYILFSGFLVL